MRIIGGTLGGRKINPPAKIPARPTTDLAKEGLFNNLNNILDFEDIKVLDLFGGTGNISFEFASRGAGNILVVEKDAICCNFIKSTAKDLHISNLQVIQGDVFSFIRTASQQFDVIFADPPYALNQMIELPDLIFNQNLLFDDSLLIIEHDNKISFSEHPRCFREKAYGNSVFSFFE